MRGRRGKKTSKRRLDVSQRVSSPASRHDTRASAHGCGNSKGTDAATRCTNQTTHRVSCVRAAALRQRNPASRAPIPTHAARAATAAHPSTVVATEKALAKRANNTKNEEVTPHEKSKVGSASRTCGESTPTRHTTVHVDAATLRADATRLLHEPDYSQSALRPRRGKERCTRKRKAARRHTLARASLASAKLEHVKVQSIRSSTQHRTHASHIAAPGSRHWQAQSKRRLTECLSPALQTWAGHSHGEPPPQGKETP